MCKRDPMVDPREGDVLYHKCSELQIVVDFVDNEQIYFRVVGADGALHNASIVTLKNWRELAPQQGKL